MDMSREQVDTPAAGRVYPAHPAEVGGGLRIWRALPQRDLPTVGPWCFLDHFGPLAIGSGPGIRVGPHPHIGLQTVTWLIEGEVLHRDSLGFEQIIRPGQLNLMTAGRGIVHSEETPVPNGGRLHGLQLWAALPAADRGMEPGFVHHPRLPIHEAGDLAATVLVGRAFGLASPATLQAGAVGIDLALRGGGGHEVVLEPGFEHALVVVQGEASVDARALRPGEMLYLAPGRRALEIATQAPARALLVGGAPFGEPVLLWWNFVARSWDEIRAARQAWVDGTGFGTVRGYDGPVLVAPELEEGA